MKPNSIANPLIAWSVLAQKTCEMLFASVQVIGHRSARILAAGANPGARDRREFTLMGQEKIEAFSRSGQAAMIRMIAINQQLGTLVLKQLISSAGHVISISSSPMLALSGKRQAQLLRAAMANSTAASLKLSASAAQLAHQALMPIHSRATGNARRLARALNEKGARQDGAP